MASPLADEPVDTDATDDEPLSEDEAQEFLTDLDGAVWDVINNHHLEATYEFEDFRDALEFTYEVGELAEKAWHHPNLSLQWGEVGVEIWTHEVDGLQKPDFVMAAKMDRIYEDYT